MTHDALGQRLVSDGLLTPAQLKTAVEFQQSLGGDLKSIVVKLGYVKAAQVAAVAASLAADEAATSGQIDERVVDFGALRQLPRELLNKHVVIPLRSDGSSLVLAMADPNDLTAIEEIQFLVDRRVEPAVASRAAIKRALDRLDDLIMRHEKASRSTQAAPAAPERHTHPAAALAGLTLEQLVRAYVLARIERGELTLEELLAQVPGLSAER